MVYRFPVPKKVSGYVFGTVWKMTKWTTKFLEMQSIGGLTKLDFAQLLQLPHLPFNECIVVRVGFRRDKLPSPVNSGTKL